jgi:hypothetical protein
LSKSWRENYDECLIKGFQSMAVTEATNKQMLKQKLMLSLGIFLYLFISNSQSVLRSTFYPPAIFCLLVCYVFFNETLCSVLHKVLPSTVTIKNQKEHIRKIHLLQKQINSICELYV